MFLAPLLSAALASAAPPVAIVTVAPGADPSAVAADHGIAPEYVYDEVLHGFAASVPDLARAGLLRDGRVLRLEDDAAVALVETAASWGLDRIDQRSRPLDGSYTAPAHGTGATAYIVDTGIRYTHTEFGGRAYFGYDAYGGDGSDCNGHGTHVAGTVGGAKYGVAGDVDLVAVRVLDCNGSGTMSGVLAGLDWIAKNALGPSVVNMSLAGSGYATLDTAVANLHALGIPVVVAAGNANTDACKYSPARAPDAITVGATDTYDARASYSNYGTCIDLFAPGSGITSAWVTSDTWTAKASGTSMASPHVAGVAAAYLESYPEATADGVTAALRAATTKGIVTNSLSTNADLLNTAYGAGVTEPDPGPGPTPTNGAPTADFSFSCTGLSCAFTDRSDDADGYVAKWAWSFGDGGSSTARGPSHTFPADGTYGVSLTVTDDDGATASRTQSVTVVAPVAAPVSLSVYAAKTKGKHTPTLAWAGATTSSVVVWRDGESVATTPNDGSHVDAPGGKGSATYTYRVCETGGGACSADVVATY